MEHEPTKAEKRRASGALAFHAAAFAKLNPQTEASERAAVLALLYSWCWPRPPETSNAP